MSGLSQSGGPTINLSSSHPQIINPPPTATIPAGSNVTSLFIPTSVPAQTTTVTLTATDGFYTFSQPVTVTVPSCVATTCAAQGASCGDIPNGCGGTIFCGACTAPETCGGGGTPNACGCTATTCAAQGAECGSLSDGCGGTLSCGTCTAPETCGGGGTPNVCGEGGGAGDTGFLSPTAQSANVGGDGNGFESSPANAFASDGLFAVDNNSGDGNNTSCTDTKKDKHRFYNYGFSFPAGVAIKGIEVRLDAKVDSTSGSPKMCVQLSWDGGSTWTSTKSTPTLGTSLGTYVLGSATDTWGRAWTTANLSNASFRVRVIDVSSSTSRDFSLDWVAVRVHY